MGTITQAQITGTTIESRSYWNNYWKLKLLEQLLKTEITGYFLELFAVKKE